MPANLALHQAIVDTGDQVLESVNVSARRGVAKAILSREVVAEVMFSAIVEVRRERVYVLRRVDGGPDWVVQRSGGCGCGTDVDGALPDLSVYRG